MGVRDFARKFESALTCPQMALAQYTRAFLIHPRTLVSRFKKNTFNNLEAEFPEDLKKSGAMHEVERGYEIKRGRTER